MRGHQYCHIETNRTGTTAIDDWQGNSTRGQLIDRPFPHPHAHAMPCTRASFFVFVLCDYFNGGQTAGSRCRSDLFAAEKAKTERIMSTKSRAAHLQTRCVLCLYALTTQFAEKLPQLHKLELKFTKLNTSAVPMARNTSAIYVFPQQSKKIRNDTASTAINHTSRGESLYHYNKHNRTHPD